MKPESRPPSKQRVDDPPIKVDDCSFESPTERLVNVNLNSEEPRNNSLRGNREDVPIVHEIGEVIPSSEVGPRWGVIVSFDLEEGLRRTGGWVVVTYYRNAG
jgi:hypothetical protein